MNQIAHSSTFRALGDARWITSDNWLSEPTRHLPVIGTIFDAAESDRVTLLLAVGGVALIHLNEKPITSHVLEPGYVDYESVTEVTSYDLSPLVTDGENSLTIEIGPGMYKSATLGERWTKLRTDYGDLAVKAVIEIKDASGVRYILSGLSWFATDSGTVCSNWVGGEDFDDERRQRLRERPVREWQQAVEAPAPPPGRLVARRSDPLHVAERIPAASIWKNGDAWVIDFGVNVAGWPSLRIPPKSSVTLRPAELVRDDGSVDVATQGWGPVFHTVRTYDRSIQWHPSFMYNGFRYVEVSGLSTPPEAAACEALVIHAEVDATGSFECSDKHLNQLQNLITRSVKSNMMSVFTDCPQREKLGYLEQLHAAFASVAWNFDANSILSRSVELIAQSQREDGSFPLFVPEWEAFPEPWTGDINWGGAMGFLPDLLHAEYGDLGPAQTALPRLRDYIRFLLDQRVDGLLAVGLGDWDGREFRFVPTVASTTLYRLLLVSATLAERQGEHQVARTWRSTAEDVKAAVNRQLLVPGIGYGSGTVAENAVALHSGIVPPEQRAALVDRCESGVIESGFSPDVGEIAMTCLVEVLAENRRHETLFALTRPSDLPGYGYMLSHGATALTETWDGPTFGFSQNHFMNAAIASWLYGSVLGVRQSSGSFGYTNIVIDPWVAGPITRAAGRFRTNHGIGLVKWVRADQAIVVSGSLPPDVSAVVMLPGIEPVLATGTFRVTDVGLTHLPS